jgi:tryptophan synthase beta chain
MFAYGRYNDGKMADYVPGDDEIEASLARLPAIGAADPT